MLKERLLVLMSFVWLLFNTVQAQTPAFTKTSKGIIVYTHPQFTETPQTVELEVITDNIMRVKAAPGKNIPAVNSLITDISKKLNLVWTVLSSKESVTLKTKALSAVIQLQSGAVAYYDA